MSKWEMVRLGDVLDYEQPTKYIVENDLYNDDYKTPVLTAGKTFILGYTNETSGIYEDIPVIIFDDFTTATKYVDFTFKVKSSAMKILKATSGASLKYIYYLMTTINVDTGLHKRYWISKYANLQIPLPPLAEQEKIAYELDKISDLIAKRKSQIEKLDLLVKAKFVEMFGDPVENPMGWRKSKLGQICRIYRGASPRPIDNYLGGTVPWIKIGDATKGDEIYISSTKDYVTEEGANKSRMIRCGGLIFANCGVSLGFARILKLDGCIHDGWLAFEKYESHLNQIFFLKAINFSTLYFRQTAPDGTQPNLNTGIMKEFQQICPPLALQTQFANYVQTVEKSKAKMEQGLAELETLYKARMQEYFG